MKIDREFITKATLSKFIGEIAIGIVAVLIGLAYWFDSVWIEIPIKERFAFVPWVLLTYSYALCSVYERTHKNVQKIPKKTIRKNYKYTLFWGIFFMLFHYFYIPIKLNPDIANQIIISDVYGIYSAISGINSLIGSTILGRAFPGLQLLGFVISGYGVIKAGLARIHINGYWNKDVMDYDDLNVVKEGPYSTARHPIYFGQILLVLGTAMICGDIIMYVFLIIVSSMNNKRALAEEEELINLFDQKIKDGVVTTNRYSEYKNEVKYFMIDRIH